ncbi:hypothetical protein [Rhodanobacter glycinis]|uniref:Uncharacterized protein n=1 Tax=Rhodanobacter glycinis TaxID=582702 RepID=A0A1I4G4D8_9GAMM|nr:hypothetical protein [Rhodanobacter glycinis]SFL24915.1 hypothetical protein SAMN05192579_12149 [Rhodanobacter glycinis]
MATQARRHMPALLAFFSLAFATALVAYESAHGGVQSHHLLDRPDLPAISNWFGLIVLPLLGWLLGIRLRNHLTSSTRFGLPAGIRAGLACSLLYGTAMATSFVLGISTVTSGLFFGLFLLAVVLPIYRIECIFGFVVGMAFAFGAVLPALVAVVFAAISALLHAIFRATMSAMRSRRQARSNDASRQVR